MDGIPYWFEFHIKKVKLRVQIRVHGREGVGTFLVISIEIVVKKLCLSPGDIHTVTIR